MLPHVQIVERCPRTVAPGALLAGQPGYYVDFQHVRDATRTLHATDAVGDANLVSPMQRAADGFLALEAESHWTRTPLRALLGNQRLWLPVDIER